MNRAGPICVALLLGLVAACATKRASAPPPPPEPECLRLDRSTGVYREVDCAGSDADGDGLDDAADLCPEARETPNEVDDGDGCPDPDADGDRVADEEDDCPRIAGPRPTGCPVTDTDGDRLADHLDSCPDSAEDFNGVDDHDGCPDGADVVVVARKDAIYIRQPIHFLKKSAMLLPDSKAMLDRVAEQLEPHADRITRIRVVGHADRREIRKKRQIALSRTRARIVARYLVYQGFNRSLFETEARGARQPASQGRKKRDRERNQRVELLVTLTRTSAVAGTAVRTGAPKAEGGGPSAEGNSGGVVEPRAEVVEPRAEVVEPRAEVVEPKAEVVEPKAEVVEPKADDGDAAPYSEEDEWDSEFLDDDWDAKFIN